MKFHVFPKIRITKEGTCGPLYSINSDGSAKIYENLLVAKPPLPVLRTFLLVCGLAKNAPSLFVR
jgi:hypothetical protein